MQATYIIPKLPPSENLESARVLKALNLASRALAELKGRVGTLPNQGILIDTLALQEAQASSEIENIVTTQDQLFQLGTQKPDSVVDPNQKEVARYRDALHCGYERLRHQHGLITNNLIIEMFQVLKQSDGSFRSTPGTTLKNDMTGEVIFVPPQHPDDIQAHMTALERYINDEQPDGYDPLVRMAIVHHQFESIHPFPDGNGRLGRILNVLYLVKNDLLPAPILYLSRYITRNKDRYYRLLQTTRDQDTWEEWILFMLKGVEEIAEETSWLIGVIKEQMAHVKTQLRTHHTNVYSQDLLNNLFRHPYTRIEYVMQDLSVSRPTATRYLNVLSKGEHPILTRLKVGRAVYFLNAPLVNLFFQGLSGKEEKA